jgi:Trk K+ transport system NAD-binding subunit
VPNVLLITIRRLRAPLILIILIFAASTIGLTLIPGIDEAGRPWRMTIFQAFYFVTYTATTIGFGEVPHAFTDQQRLFATVIIYLSVIGWAYLLGAMLNLVQDKGFQQAVTTNRFRRSVARIGEPFYLVCGLGDSGMAVVRALDRLGYRFTALDKDERKIQELEVEGMSSDAPALAADARSPETLAQAGLLKPECRGVLALCSDDETNFAVALSASILRPGLPVIGRADTATMAVSMASFGTYRVINPFREFGEYLGLAMRAPDTFRLMSWFTSTPGAYLFPSSPTRIPSAPGHWIVCGYGRFGREVATAVKQGGFTAAIVDQVGAHADGVRCIRGHGTDIEVLREAGAETATGIVAGTDDDMANLAIALTARRLKPEIFVIVRQNEQSSSLLFSRVGANMTMVPSQIVANQCVAALRTPLLAEFLDTVRCKDDWWAYSLSERLRSLLGVESPRFWSFTLNADDAPGLIEVMDRAPRPVAIGDLLRDPQRRDGRLAGVTLMVVRTGVTIELPDDDFELAQGDQLLFAGRSVAEEAQRIMRGNATIATYVLDGRTEAEGLVWRSIGRAFGR